MASFASNQLTSIPFTAAALLVPFRATGRCMITLAESSFQMRALTRLSEMSDSDLAAKRQSREREIRRIMGVSAAI